MSPDSSAPKDSWLTLGAASALLGVSESTVRRWADAGEIRSYKTPGGHRRVYEEDLRQIAAGAPPPGSRDTDHISDIALARVKRRMSRGRQGNPMAAFENFDADTRDRMRLMGRQLVDLVARFIASDSRKDRFAEDARTIGREYGRTLVGANVRLSVAVATFNNFRRPLEETASQIAGEAGLPTEDAIEAIESILVLADVVLEGLAEVYEGAVAKPAAGTGPVPSTP